MIRKKYSAFFFDFDGVLADSVEVKTRAFAKLFEHYGPVIVAKVVDHHRKNGGMTRVDKFYHYYREVLGQPLNEVGSQQLCDDFSRFVVEPGSNPFARTSAGDTPNCPMICLRDESRRFETRLMIIRSSAGDMRRRRATRSMEKGACDSAEITSVR